MEWWMWIVAGFVLLGLEVASGTFYVMFFALGALIVGAIRVIGIADPIWLQLLLFAVISVVSLLAFRGPLFDRLRGGTANEGIDDIRRELAVAVAAIAPNEIGKAELRGVPWSARNVGDVAIEAGEECAIDKVDGLTLLVRMQG